MNAKQEAEKSLWSDKHTEYDCDGIDRYTVIYNMYEDVRCLKEKLEATEHKLAEAEKVVEAAEVLFNFNNEQHLLDKNNGHYVGRNKNTIALLCALSDYEASKEYTSQEVGGE